MCARSQADEAGEAIVVDAETKKQMLKKQKRMAIRMMRETEKSTEVNAPQLVDTLDKDLLALSTAYYRLLMCLFSDYCSRFQKTKTYTVLFRTTQPAHVITLIAVGLIATLVRPLGDQSQSVVRPSPLINLIYLASFIVHFGSQIWMTFVSGLTLYFAVPRHIFGQVQKALFPKYFSINSFLSLVTLVVFVKLHPSNTWDSYIKCQVAAMVACFLLELSIRLYLTPPLLRLLAAKIAMEKAAGVGLEVGKHDAGLLAQCPHYVRIHKMFRKIHMTIAIGNIFAMACTTFHLIYLSSKICFL